MLYLGTISDPGVGYDFGDKRGKYISGDKDSLVKIFRELAGLLVAKRNALHAQTVPRYTLFWRIHWLLKDF